MKTFFTLIFCLATTFLASAGIKTDIAVENYPGANNVVNGRYAYDGLGAAGYPQYRANRSDDTFIAPQIIRFNPLVNRWELYITKMVSGTPTSQLAATSPGSGTGIVGKKWTVFYPYGNPLGLYTALNVYETVVHTTVPGWDYSIWSDGRSWSSGFVPRTYDNVIITKSFNVNIEAKCNNLKLVEGTSGSFTVLTGAYAYSAVRIHGKLEQDVYTMIDLPEIEFRGNELQTVSADLSRGYSMRVDRVLINNPKNIQLLTSIGFMARVGSKCETRLVKGKVLIGAHVLTCQNITGADASRFFVTNGTGALYLTARTGTDPNFQFFPVGPSPERYTPMWVYFGSANRDYSNLLASAAYNPSLFLPGHHVNVMYTVNHGSVVPAPGTLLSWVYQFQWNAGDATTGFDYSDRIESRKWNGTSWSAGISEGVATGSGPYKYTFGSREGRVVTFGIHAVTKRLAGERIGAEEVEMNKSEIELDYAPFPNPAPASGFRVHVNDPATAQLRMQSLSGTVIDIATRVDSEHQLAVQPTRNITTGIYLLQVKEGSNTRVHKVLIR
ncbi:MAG: T9SS type A sorting domain-containing protein [Dyadobacter sp.]|uniref:T9SS type A sorting domain-containing protein n=1 Tax=Dyadobacter sp. TaxID=1914288 RepID=UPI003266B95F